MTNIFEIFLAEISLEEWSDRQVALGSLFVYNRMSGEYFCLKLKSESYVAKMNLLIINNGIYVNNEIFILFSERKGVKIECIYSVHINNILLSSLNSSTQTR